MFANVLIKHISILIKARLVLELIIGLSVYDDTVFFRDHIMVLLTLIFLTK